MKFKVLMIFKAAVCLVLGIPIVIYPQFIYSLFGADVSAGGIFAARQYGAGLLGIMLICWFGRKAEESIARRAVILGLFVYDAIGVIVTLIAIFTKEISPLGWLIVALYLILALGFGYFLIKKPQP